MSDNKPASTNILLCGVVDVLSIEPDVFNIGYFSVDSTAMTACASIRRALVAEQPLGIVPLVPLSLNAFTCFLSANPSLQQAFVAAVFSGNADAAMSLWSAANTDPDAAKPALPASAEVGVLLAAIAAQPVVNVDVTLGSLAAAWPCLGSFDHCFDVADALRTCGIAVHTLLLAYVHVAMWVNGHVSAGTVFASKFVSIELQDDVDASAVARPRASLCKKTLITAFRCKRCPRGVGDFLARSIANVLQLSGRHAWRKPCASMLVYSEADSPLVMERILPPESTSASDVFETLRHFLEPKGYNCYSETAMHTVSPPGDEACMFLVSWGSQSHLGSSQVLVDSLPKLHTSLDMPSWKYVLVSVRICPET